MIDIQILNIIKSFIENEINNNIEKSIDINPLQHNHPPVRFKVDSCEYCNKYGNILSIK